MSTLIHLAQSVLERWQPTAVGGERQPQVAKLIKNAQERLSFALQSGNPRIALWLIENYAKALKGDRFGIAQQLRPLLIHLPDIALVNAEVAAKALTLARELDDARLYSAACIGAGEALATKAG